jgi:uncharacterized repeat protein (TIGR02543 family)
MKKSRLLLIVMLYVAAGFYSAAFNTGHAQATPIANSNLTNIDDAQRYVKANRKGYQTYTKKNTITGVTTILYHPNAGSGWNITTLPTDVLTKHNNGHADEKDACVDIFNDSYVFKTDIWANRSDGCGSNGTTTTDYRGGQVKVDPPDDFPIFLFIEDVDGLKGRQHISFTSSAIKYLYTPKTDSSFSVDGGNNLVSNGANGAPNCTGQAWCNAIVLLQAASFNIKAGSKDGNSVMHVRNNTSLPYRTLTLDPNGGSVVDAGDSVMLWSHTSGTNVLREYQQDNTASAFPVPSRAGYTPQGWYTAAVGGTLVTSQPMISDATLYAHWAPIIPNDLQCTAKFTPNPAVVEGGVTLTVSGTGRTSPPTRVSGTITGPSFSQAFAQNSSSAVVPFTPHATGQYTATATVYDSANNSISCGDTVQVGTQPYFEVKGADILAYIGGGDMSNKGILSWNNDNNSAFSGMSGYQGAGSQLAALTDGNILHYVTGGQNTTAGTSPGRLAFANVAGGYSGSGYGGNLQSLSGVSGSPYDEESAGIDASTPSYTGQSLAGLNGVYYAAGDVTIPANTTVSGGSKVTIVVAEGSNVYISGNIYYVNTSSSYGSIANIPRLNVYTKGGNIIVASGATEIRGVFVADGGTFYSCGKSAGTPIDPAYARLNNDYYNICINPLAVYGSVSADRVVLMRTKGSWNQPQGAAETFSQGPEMWLNGSSNVTSLDSYITLPPVL